MWPQDGSTFPNPRQPFPFFLVVQFHFANFQFIMFRQSSSYNQVVEYSFRSLERYNDDFKVIRFKVIYNE